MPEISNGEPGLPRPETPEEALDIIDGRLYDLREYTESRLSFLVENGATPEEQAELDTLSSRIGAAEKNAREIRLQLEQADIRVIRPGEVDEDQLYATVLSYLEIRAEHTVGAIVYREELSDSLKRQGINVEPHILGRWLGSRRSQLTNDLKLGGRDVALERIPKEYGEPPGTFGLVEDKTLPRRSRRPEVLPKSEPEPSIVPVRSLPAARAPEVDAAQQAAERREYLMRAALNLVLTNPGLPARRHRQILTELEAPRGYSELDVREAFGAQLAKQGLHKVTSGGYAFYTTEGPGESEPRRQEAAQLRPETQEPPLSKVEERAAAVVLSKLSEAHAIEFQVGISGKEINRALRGVDQKPIDKRRMNRFMRILTGAGVLETFTTVVGNQGATEFRLRASNAGILKALRDPEVRTALIAAVQAGSQFEVPEE
jgi:hypothetical protein